MTGQFSVEEALALLQVDSIANEDNIDNVIKDMMTIKQHVDEQLSILINKNNEFHGKPVATEVKDTQCSDECKSQECKKDVNPSETNPSEKPQKFFKRSKFLSDEQQRTLLKYLEDNEVAQQMTTVPARNRVKHLQDLINQNCGIQISKYMCNQLLYVWGKLRQK